MIYHSWWPFFTVVARWICGCRSSVNYWCCIQDVTEKIEQHKDIIDANNKSFYEMKKAKDAKQNERKYVDVFLSNLQCDLAVATLGSWVCAICSACLLMPWLKCVKSVIQATVSFPTTVHNCPVPSGDEQCVVDLVTVVMLTLSPRKAEKPALHTVTNSRKTKLLAYGSLIYSRKAEISAWKF